MAVRFGAQSDFPICGLCHRDLEFVDCSACGGEGGRDLYEEDPLAYALGEWAECDECEGGGFLVWCRVHGLNSPIAHRPVLVLSSDKL
jgi:hypothetical protein